MTLARQLLWIPLMLASCAGVPGEPDEPHLRDDAPIDRATAERLLARIEPGATRADVEALLGAPVWQFLGQFWYLRPELGFAVSPYVPGAIGITYERGVVVTRKLSPQLR